jgi:hypothetical protein
MFRTLKMINTLNVTYGLVFAEFLSGGRTPKEFALTKTQPIQSAN